MVIREELHSVLGGQVGENMEVAIHQKKKTRRHIHGLLCACASSQSVHHAPEDGCHVCCRNIWQGFTQPITAKKPEKTYTSNDTDRESIQLLITRRITSCIC